jgi:hypothetical protein
VKMTGTELVDIPSALTVGTTVDERLSALRWLRTAPPEPIWLRTLIIGLLDADAVVRSECRRICAERLAELDGHPELQDRFLGELLERCFIRHSANSSRSEDSGSTFAALLDDIVEFLLLRPFAYEHYRSLLLLRACDMRFTSSSASFAQALAHCHRRLANEGQRSDTDIVHQLLSYQKLRAYREPSTHETLLQDYLIQDRSLPLDQLDNALLSGYAALLRSHARNKNGVLAMLQNLQAWLRQLPHKAVQLRPIIERVMQEVGRSVPNLPSTVQLQIKSGVALAPGPSHPDDFLRSLQTYYTFDGNGEIGQAVMQALAYLPQLRARLPELYDYLSDPALRSLPASFWTGALHLIASLVTGLDDYVSDALSITSEENWRLTARRMRTEWQIALRDVPIRTFLRQLSFNREFDPAVRSLAWRTLLESLPQDDRERAKLFEAGLAASWDDLFLVSIDVARANYQRHIWRALEQQWNRLTEGDAQTPGRRQNLRQICRALGVLRIGDTVRSQPSRLPPLIELALDDPDVEVRQAATQAIAEASLGVALQAELLRRQIQRLREQITELEGRLQQLDQQHRQLTADVNQASSEIKQRESQIDVLQHQQRTMISEHDRTVRQFEQELSRVKADIGQLRIEARQYELEVQKYDLALDHQASITQNAVFRQLQIRQQVDEKSALAASLRDQITFLQDELQRAKERIGPIRRTSRVQARPTPPSIEPTPRPVNVITAELRDMRAQLNAATNQLDQLHEDLKAVAAEEKLSQREHDLIQISKRHAQRSLESRQHHIEIQLAEEARLTGEMTIEHARHREKLGTNQREIGTREAQRQQAQSQLADTQRKIQHVDQETRRARDDIARLAAEVQNGERRLGRLSQQVDDEIAQADDRGRREQQNHEQHRWEEQELLVFYAFCLEHLEAFEHAGKQSVVFVQGQ